MQELCTSLIVREMQIKTTVSFGLTPVRMAITRAPTNNKCWRGAGDKGAPCTAGGNVDRHSHFGEQCGGSSKNQKWSHHIDSP